MTKPPVVTLESLLPPDEPHGTFHDGQLRRVTVDYENASCLLEVELPVGDPDATAAAHRERMRSGRLIFTGLFFWVCEAPDPVPVVPGSAAWLTSYGPLAESPTEQGKRLARSTPAEAHAWFLYFSDLNAFAYVAAAGQAFQWA